MKKETKQAKTPTVGAIPTEKAQNTTLQVIKQGEEPQAEEVEFKQIQDFKKPALDLNQTIKIVEELHLKKRHLDLLDFSVKELEAFEIKKMAEDIDDRNHYSGCLIKISDDQRREWSTKNPVIISELVSFLKNKFSEKRAEIEAQIILPV